LQLQAAELAGVRTILMVPLCKDGRLLGDDAEAAQFPDLLARSSEILRELLGIALGDPPVCARPLGFSDYFGIRHRRFRDQLTGHHPQPPAAFRAGIRTTLTNSPRFSLSLCRSGRDNFGHGIYETRPHWPRRVADLRPQKGQSLLAAGPMVRIRLPPAGSRSRT
jgi:hypothetical protein